jgi:predicted peptidase
MPQYSLNTQNVRIWPPDQAAEQAADGPAPCIIFLHGRGERGAGGRELSLVAKWGLPKFRDEGQQLTDGPFPFVVVAPQCPADRSWWDEDVATAVEQLVDQLVNTGRCDPARLFISGFSLGGIGALCLASRRPHRYAALVSVCGFCPVEDGPARLAHLPMWIAYAEDDEFTDLTEGSKRLISALSPEGRLVSKSYRLGDTLLAKAHARTADAAFGEPNLYQWLATHGNHTTNGLATLP